MADKKQLQNALVGIGLTYGATAYLAPQALTKIYGAPEEAAGAMRLFGSRNLALAAMFLMAPDDEARDRVTTVVAAVLAADTVGALLEGATGRVSKRDVVLSVITTGASCALAVATLQA